MGKGPGKEIVRVLIYKENGHFIAHCLEFNLLADGKTVPEAIKRLVGVVTTHISHLMENNLLDKLYNPAPPELWQKLGTAKYWGDIKIKTTAKEQKLDIPRIRIPLHEMARLNLEYQGSALT